MNHHQHTARQADVLNQRLSVSEEFYNLMNIQSTCWYQALKQTKKHCFPAAVLRARVRVSYCKMCLLLSAHICQHIFNLLLLR